MREQQTDDAEQARQQNLDSFSAVMQALADYNAEHSLGKTMFKAIMHPLHREDDASTAADDEQAALRAALAARPKARTIGLDWDFNEADSAIFGPFGKIATKELRLTISDTELFLKFLKQLQPQNFAANPQLRDWLSQTIQILTHQMVRYYDDPDDPRGRALLNSAIVLLAEFRRLGMEQEIATLEIYFIHSKRRTLGEYRSLLEAQCFQPPRDHHFGPSEWYADTSAEQYEQRWQTAEQAVLNSLRNKNALVLTREATDNLVISGKRNQNRLLKII